MVLQQESYKKVTLTIFYHTVTDLSINFCKQIVILLTFGILCAIICISYYDLKTAYKQYKNTCFEGDYMKEIFKAKWIKSATLFENNCPVFCRAVTCDKKVKKATLEITGKGLYNVYINTDKLENFVFAPGWTVYDKRIQVQEYDVTNLLSSSNGLRIEAGGGWAVSRLAWEDAKGIWSDEIKIIAALYIEYEDDTTQTIVTDESFCCYKSNVLSSGLYDGEVVDYTFNDEKDYGVTVVDDSLDVLIPQEGEIIKEQESFEVKEIITTPKGELVVDFGQNITGYVAVPIKGSRGEVITISHAEVLDSEGNFYTENYRSAKALISITCDGERRIYKPSFTFFGFRYIRIDSGKDAVDIEKIRATSVYSDIKRTGEFGCSNDMLNQLYNNILWGQRGNFLDVPTDCPQRDERLGWTGDAQAFIKTATYNFDVQRFFKKWLHDLALDQFEDGRIPHVVPNVLGKDAGGSAAWSDAATICPWQIYVTYGDTEVLADQYDSMVRWVEYVKNNGDNPYLWENGTHFGDWLGLDAAPGSYKGSTNEDFIATAFFAYSTNILIKAGKVLGKEVSEYDDLLINIKKAFNERFVVDGKLTSNTQTAHVLALHFNLVEDKPSIAKQLALLVKQSGNKLTTGFVGTPYLLHALSDNGYGELAYTLLLQTEYPSWLYPVTKGATTIWEHWDGIKPDGSMWSKDMNSFNHYAYGAVYDWMFENMAGIKPCEEQPGFRHVHIRPIPDKRLGYAKASIQTKYGLICSGWIYDGDIVNYNISIPEGVTATVTIGERSFDIASGNYKY